MPTPETQVTVRLAPRQMEKIQQRLAKKKKSDSFIKQSDIIREVVEAGLQALAEK